LRTNDRPDGNTYGIVKCAALKASGPAGVTVAAEPQAILALGLYLDFSPNVNTFTWATGGINLAGEGMPDYTSWHPAPNPSSQQQQRDLAYVDALIGGTALHRKSDMRRASELRAGWRAFAA
jgi:hypothetical protein